MMLENHLRHVKPSEFNRSVIWAGRIGLVLLLLVAILVFLPFAAEQVQGASVDSSFTQSKQLHNADSGYKPKQHGGATLSMHIAIVNKSSSFVFLPHAVLPDKWEIVSLALVESNKAQFAY